MNVRLCPVTFAEVNNSCTDFFIEIVLIIPEGDRI